VKPPSIPFVPFFLEPLLQAGKLDKDRRSFLPGGRPDLWNALLGPRTPSLTRTFSPPPPFPPPPVLFHEGQSSMAFLVSAGRKSLVVLVTPCCSKTDPRSKAGKAPLGQYTCRPRASLHLSPGKRFSPGALFVSPVVAELLSLVAGFLRACNAPCFDPRAPTLFSLHSLCERLRPVEVPLAFVFLQVLRPDFLPSLVARERSPTLFHLCSFRS